MSIGEMLLIIGIVLAVAAVLFGHPCWVFAVKAFLRLVALVLLSAGGP